MAKYRDLLMILKRNGAQNIEMPVDEMIPFVRYINKEKYTEKLYFEIKKGKLNVSKTSNNKPQLIV